MQTNSSRYALPNLFIGQAGKELTYNEAIFLIDILLHACVEAEANDPTQISNAQSGQAWLISNAPVGQWEYHAGKVAAWDGGGWRYIMPIDGMRLFNKESSTYMTLKSGAWHHPTIIAEPESGSVIDSEARESINLILDQLRMSGLVSGTA